MAGLVIASFNTAVSHVIGGVCSPYCASIKYKNANSRKGPGEQYKVAYEYVTQGIPVVITAKYDHWRKIIDPDGSESWIHKCKLSSKRFVMVVNGDGADLKDACSDNAGTIAHLRRNVIMSLLSVSRNWCKVAVRGRGDGKYLGWVEKKKVFGVLNDEI
jgi:SH3-like domain-containing protein